MVGQSGSGRHTDDAGGGGNSRASSADSVSSSGSGQLRPAASARCRYSPTVLRATATLRAMTRCDCPAAWSRRTSLILRMDNRSAAISTSAGVNLPRRSYCRLRGFDCPASLQLPGGRNAPESVAGMLRIRWPASTGIDGRLGPEYAGDTAHFHLGNEYDRFNHSPPPGRVGPRSPRFHNLHLNVGHVNWLCRPRGLVLTGYSVVIWLGVRSHDVLRLCCDLRLGFPKALGLR
jgi:hypothetical protein